MAERLKQLERYKGFPNLNHLEPDEFPDHTVVVMDGNRHWGEEHLGDRLAGHTEGAKASIRIMKAALPLPGKVFTFWGFSADNWKRKNEEIDRLMSIIDTTINENSEELIDSGIRFMHLGRKDRIPSDLANNIDSLEKATADNNGKILCAAIDFGGEDQEIRLNAITAKTAVQIARAMPFLSDEEIADSVDKDWITTSRDGAGIIPPADLIIRPQHYRTSDIGWLNGSATELYARPDLQFPDMKPQHLEEAILFYTRDKQNYGS